MIGFMLALAAITITSDTGDSTSLTLVCGGGGSALQSDTRAGFNDIAVVEIRGDTGRIRAPAMMKPDFSSGAKDGWRELRDVRVSEREITARYGYNFLNRPEVHIDRTTGVLRISGKASFNGQCRAVDSVERAF